MEFFKKTNVNFIGNRHKAYVFSIAVLVIGLAALALRGGPKYSIDFIEGTLLEFHFTPPVTTAEMRHALGSVTIGDKQMNFAESEIQALGDKGDLLVRVGESEKGTSAAEAIKAKLRQTFADRIPADEEEWLRRQEKVGPKIGGEMKKSAIFAVIVSLILILLYVAWRFEFRFGVAAVISIFHDVLVTLGILTMLGMEFSMTVLAALLTIVGYSINDTIVVCDRIRENRKILRREKFGDMVNISINQTLSRTILTAGTVWLVSWVLFFAGGEVIHGFATALLIGVFFGTYSSIFVVSSLVVDWVNSQEKKRLEKLARKA